MNLWQDLRYGSRMLIKQRGYALVAIFTLALGIGANTAIFSVANALLLKPLPFEELDRLVAIRERLQDQGLKATSVSAADYIDWRDQATHFQQIAAYRISNIIITGSSEPEMLRCSYVSGDFFSALQIPATHGRVLIPDEDRPGSNQVAVLGFGLWQQRFAGDPDILGGSIIINGRNVTIVGIMPQDFDYPFGTEVWMPLGLTPQDANQRQLRNLQVIARLKPEVSITQAQSGMLAVAETIARQHPLTNTGVSVEVIPLRDLQADFSRPLLSVLLGCAAFLLLLACANVANLSLASATSRHKEMAIRSALGANRWQIIRQLMIENLLLSTLAGLAGLVLAMWAVDLIKGSLPPDIARFMAGWKEIGIDRRTLAFTIGTASLTTILFGLVPALQASRINLNDTLKDGGRSSGPTTTGARVRKLLIVSEVALALVLLVGAGLTIRGFLRVLSCLDQADTDDILTMQIPLQESRYKDPQKISDFYQQLISRMNNLSGIETVSISSNTPLNNSPNPSVEMTIDGQAPLFPGERQLADLMVISPGYFSTIRARLIRGRDFAYGDGWKTMPVAIISETMAHRYFPIEDPLGQTFSLSGPIADDRKFTIVGIVSDVRQAWFDREVRPQVYLDFLQSPRPNMTLLLRTSKDPTGFIAATRSQIQAVDEDQPVNDIKTLSKLIVDETSPFRFVASLMIAFGAIALILSTVGVYSVVSYSVIERTREIGIRIALGAKPSEILRLIMRQSISMVTLGLALGLPLALALGKIMTNQLFGIVALEYGVLIGLAVLLLAVSFLSSSIPASRAIRIDPMLALRYE